MMQQGPGESRAAMTIEEKVLIILGQSLLLMSDTSLARIICLYSNYLEWGESFERGEYSAELERKLEVSKRKKPFANGNL